ncbi:MAG TPA: AAA family ATPase [Solirubrobacteraceae bacterium]|nr:AAA family ATPase [Solirubrobacteraceae bacterium]
MESLVVYGRDHELSLADGFLDVAGERFAVLRLEGEPGIGKTTVWREVVRQAEERGFRVLSCRPAEMEAKLALSALSDLLDHLPSASFAELPVPQRRALDIALLRVEPEAGEVDPRTLGTAVRSLLANLAAEKPLLVAIDDVQWLDLASASVLEFALRRLAGARIGWLFAQRADQPPRLTSDALAAREAVTDVKLGPLTVAALYRVLKQRDRKLTRPTLIRVHEASGGNPLFALEIVHELGSSASSEPRARLPVPGSVRELLAERIRRFPEEVWKTLLAAAALSHPTAALVKRASCADALAAAQETGLIAVDGDRISFAHTLYASAIYESATGTQVRELHGRLARLITDPEERARHLAIAATEADEDIARALEAGAAAARARGAWESAADLLEHARRLAAPDRPGDAAKRGIAAAEHHVRAGDRTRARALLEELLAGPLPRPLLADALRLLAEITYNDGYSDAAKRLLAEALEHADDALQAAAIELALAYLSGQLADPAAGTAHAYRALARAEEAGDRSHIAAALALCAVFDYLCGLGVDWEKVERSLALETPDRIMPLVQSASVVAALLALYVGRHSEARERLAAVSAAARERGDESDLGFVLMWRSWLETRSGNLAEAATLADEAAAIAMLTGSPASHATTLAQRALVLAHTGHAEQVRRDCADAAALVEQLGNPWIGVWIAAALGLLELSLGNAEAAWEACAPATQALEQHGIAEPVPAFFLPEALEALIVLGRLDRAEALVDALEARGRELDRAWARATGGRCRGLLLATRGDLGGATTALDGALAEHDRIEMPFERARTLLARGLVERRARRRTQAKQSFEEALAIFDRMGATVWAERARQELGRLGLRRSTGGELTESERRVAELAAQGMTNREVAAALFISAKTVEANLARAYRKLGIASRAELGARMVEERVQT